VTLVKYHEAAEDELLNEVGYLELRVHNLCSLIASILVKKNYSPNCAVKSAKVGALEGK
jgi:hypothetical protein